MTTRKVSRKAIRDEINGQRCRMDVDLNIIWYVIVVFYIHNIKFGECKRRAKAVSKGISYRKYEQKRRCTYWRGRYEMESSHRTMSRNCGI